MGVGADLGKFLSTEWLFKLLFFLMIALKKVLRFRQNLIIYMWFVVNISGHILKRCWRKDHLLLGKNNSNNKKPLQHLLLYHFNFFKLKFSLSQLYDSNQQGLLLALQATLFSLQWNYFQSEHNQNTFSLVNTLQ